MPQLLSVLLTEFMPAFEIVFVKIDFLVVDCDRRKTNKDLLIEPEIVALIDVSVFPLDMTEQTKTRMSEHDPRSTSQPFPWSPLSIWEARVDDGINPKESIILTWQSPPE